MGCSPAQDPLGAWPGVPRQPAWRLRIKRSNRHHMARYVAPRVACSDDARMWSTLSRQAVQPMPYHRDHCVPYRPALPVSHCVTQQGATPHVTLGGKHSAASTGLPAAASSGAPWLASPEFTAGALCAVPPATHCGAAPTGPRRPPAGESYCGPTRLDTLSCTVVRYVRHYAPRYVPDRVLHYAAYPARGRALRRAAPRLLNHALRPLWRPR